MSIFTRIFGRNPGGSGAEQRSFSISDPGLVEYLGLSRQTSAGKHVTEQTALSLTAVWRAVSLLSGTIATLPLKTYRTLPDGTRERVPSFLDNPGGPDGPSPFEWKEQVMSHLLLHGNAYLVHIYNGAGGIVGLQPIHPSAVSVRVDDAVPGRKVFEVSLIDGTKREFTRTNLTHVMGLSTDGIVGISPIRAVRESLATAMASDEAAARIFTNGLMLGGLVSGDDDLTEEQGEQLKAKLKAKMAGPRHAGDIAIVNANLKFTPWSMSADDAQFLEQRAFGVEEVARIYGVPKVLLAEDGASTWGAGIAELLRAMARFTLSAYTTRIEEKLSDLLPRSRYVEFDYAGLLQPNPEDVTKNLVGEIQAGLLTVDEARQLLNRPPLTGPTPQEG